MKDRIKEARKAKNMTQEALASALGLTRTYINLVESGKKVPADRTVRDIADILDVNKEWLLTGLGDPYVKRTRNQEIQAYANTLMEDVDESFRKRFFLALSKLDESQWELLEQIMDTLKKD